MLIFIKFFLNSLNLLWIYIFFYFRNMNSSVAKVKQQKKLNLALFFHFMDIWFTHFMPQRMDFWVLHQGNITTNQSFLFYFEKKNFWHKNSFHKFFVWHNFSQFLPLQEKCKNCKKINLIDLIPIFSKDPQFDVQNAIYSSPKSEIRSRKI